MRFNADDSNGWIKWPKAPGYHNTHEGGMSVYAIWPNSNENGYGDRFYQCFPGLGIKASIHESPVSDISEVRELHLLAVLCLGTSGGSWFNGDGEHYWHATLADITEEGSLVLNSLEKLYGRQPVLVTILDT